MLGKAPAAGRSTWISWPSEGALHRSGNIDSPHRRFEHLIRGVLSVGYTGYAVASLDGPQLLWRRLGLLAVLVSFVALLRWIFRRCVAHDTTSVVLGVAGMAAAQLASLALGARDVNAVLAAVLLCTVTQWAPLVTPFLGALVSLSVELVRSGWNETWNDNWSIVVIILACTLGGFGARGNWEARAYTRRLLAEEQAARTAEQTAAAARAESAALSERARIARDIHDVLAHSLSAQVVHLEAARLLLERGEPTEETRHRALERVVDARAMARGGLHEAREALSTLRGDTVPAARQVSELARTEDARVEVVGDPRPLPPETGQTVRRVTQEALTNVRKHAPGAVATVTLRYLTESVTLEVRDDGRHVGTSARQSPCPRNSPNGENADNGPLKGDTADNVAQSGDTPHGDTTRGELTAERPTEENSQQDQLTHSGSGYGLRGMRERAELLGGELDAHPTEEGFRVWLSVPTS